jgi:hypothetical protein
LGAGAFPGLLRRFGSVRESCSCFKYRSSPGFLRSLNLAVVAALSPVHRRSAAWWTPQFQQIVDLYNLVEDKQDKGSGQEKRPDDQEGAPADAKRPLTFDRDGFLAKALRALFVATAAAAILGLVIATVLQAM